MKVKNSVLERLAFVGLIVPIHDIFTFCMVYKITVEDKSCRVKRLLTRSKMKESGIVAAHLKSNKAAYVLFR